MMFHVVTEGHMLENGPDKGSIKTATSITNAHRLLSVVHIHGPQTPHYGEARLSCYWMLTSSMNYYSKSILDQQNYSTVTQDKHLTLTTM